METNIPPSVSLPRSEDEETKERASSPLLNSPASNSKSSTTTPRTSVSAPPSPAASAHPDTDFLDDVFGSPTSAHALPNDNDLQSDAELYIDSELGILSDSADHLTPSSMLNAYQTREAHPSDIPRLRSVHATAGYRDGVAAARDAAVQGGFDEGYLLGAALGVRAGVLLGIMEGILEGLGGLTDGADKRSAAKSVEDAGRKRKGGTSGAIEVDYEKHVDVEDHPAVRLAEMGKARSPPQMQQHSQAQALTPTLHNTKSRMPSIKLEDIPATAAAAAAALKQMRIELTVASLLGPDYIEADGTWRWTTNRLQDLGFSSDSGDEQGLSNDPSPGKNLHHRGDADMNLKNPTPQAEEASSLDVIADAHPLLQKWASITRSWMDVADIERNLIALERG